MALFMETAERILRESKKKQLHSNEITRIAIENGYLKTEGLTPEKTMSARLQDDIKLHGELSLFKKVGPNLFALNEKRIEFDETESPDRVLDEFNVQKLKDLYTGKAGEHAVLSELLFLGYNAASMSVDTGMDIIATKARKQFVIQVKTRNVGKNVGEFLFDVTTTSVERHSEGGAFYIFVLRDAGKLDYVILPLYQLEKSIDEKFVYITGEGKVYRVAIRKKGERVYLGRKENDITYCLNNWEIIK